MASNKSNFRKCTRGGREWNSATLRDGALAGDFSILKRTTSMTTCKELCCANDSCELALLVNGGCFSVQCKSAEACMPQSVKRDGVVAPRIFVRNIGKEANYFFHISQRFLALYIRSNLVLFHKNEEYFGWALQRTNHGFVSFPCAFLMWILTYHFSRYSWQSGILITEWEYFGCLLNSGQDLCDQKLKS